jgi:putative hydrolase of the HAD superfamily
MKRSKEITTLFLDIGGILLTDGWQHESRKRAAEAFHLDLSEMEDRHHLTFDTYEQGKLTQFRRFMFAQSKSYPEMIELVRRLKTKHGLQIIVVSNEARELNAYRIRKFRLDRFVDAFVSSCFVHLQKSDADIFRLALDIAQAPVRQVLYIENTPMFVQIAEGLGIRSVLHKDYKSTRAQLAAVGLKIVG